MDMCNPPSHGIVCIHEREYMDMWNQLSHGIVCIHEREYMEILKTLHLRQCMDLVDLHLINL